MNGAENRLYGPPKGGGIGRWPGAVAVAGHIAGDLLLRLNEQAENGTLGDLHYEGVGRYGLGGALFWVGRLPKEDRAECGAKTRRGTACRAKCAEGRERCRMHGGLSTGAKTPEGRARISESNRRRAQLRRDARIEAGGE